MTILKVEHGGVASEQLSPERNTLLVFIFLARKQPDLSAAKELLLSLFGTEQADMLIKIIAKVCLARKCINQTPLILDSKPSANFDQWLQGMELCSYICRK